MDRNKEEERFGTGKIENKRKENDIKSCEKKKT